MSNPEFLGQQCDGCGGHLHDTGNTIDRYDVREWRGTHWYNHSEANQHARAAGWYIAERDLCPECREKMEVPSC